MNDPRHARARPAPPCRGERPPAWMRAYRTQAAGRGRACPPRASLERASIHLPSGIACLDSSFRWNDDGGKIVTAIANTRMRSIIEVRDRASI